MTILKRNIFTNEQLSSCFRKSFLFQLFWPAVVPDLDHNLASKCVGSLYIHWMYKYMISQPNLVSEVQSVPST